MRLKKTREARKTWNPSEFSRNLPKVPNFDFAALPFPFSSVLLAPSLRASFAPWRPGTGPSDPVGHYPKISRWWVMSLSKEKMRKQQGSASNLFRASWKRLWTWCRKITFWKCRELRTSGQNNIGGSAVTRHFISDFSGAQIKKCTTFHLLLTAALGWTRRLGPHRYDILRGRRKTSSWSNTSWGCFAENSGKNFISWNHVPSTDNSQTCTWVHVMISLA